MADEKREAIKDGSSQVSSEQQTTEILNPNLSGKQHLIPVKSYVTGCLSGCYFYALV